MKDLELSTWEKLKDYVAVCSLALLVVASFGLISPAGCGGDDTTGSIVQTSVPEGEESDEDRLESQLERGVIQPIGYPTNNDNEQNRPPDIYVDPDQINIATTTNGISVSFNQDALTIVDDTDDDDDLWENPTTFDANVSCVGSDAIYDFASGLESETQKGVKDFSILIPNSATQGTQTHYLKSMTTCNISLIVSDLNMAATHIYLSLDLSKII